MVNNGPVSMETSAREPNLFHNRAAEIPDTITDQGHQLHPLIAPESGESLLPKTNPTKAAPMCRDTAETSKLPTMVMII